MDNFMKQHYLPTAEQAYEGQDEAPADAAAEETEETQHPAEAGNTGILTRLQEHTKQAAQRTAQTKSCRGFCRTKELATRSLKQSSTYTVTFATSISRLHSHPKAISENILSSTVESWQTPCGSNFPPVIRDQSQC